MCFLILKWLSIINLTQNTVDPRNPKTHFPKTLVNCKDFVQNQKFTIGATLIKKKRFPNPEGIFNIKKAFSIINMNNNPKASPFHPRVIGALTGY